jgi:hypothetical protein
MTNQAKNYLPANKCIYCGATDVPLSREHIIPFSLGGNYVLQRASCAIHAEITSQFERDFAAVAYGYYRAENKVRSRKPKKLADSMNAMVELEGEDFDGNKVKVHVPISEAPPVPVVVRLKEPGILLGTPKDSLYDITLEMPPQHDPRLRALREKKGLASLRSAATTLPVTHMLRTLAKIAHAYATAELGPDSFDPCLLEIIKEPKASGPAYFIGEHNPPLPQAEQELSYREVKINDEIWIVVDISLHFFTRIPRYQVFVGTRTNLLAS